jgi:hypothetical protein
MVDVGDGRNEIEDDVPKRSACLKIGCTLSSISFEPSQKPLFEPNFARELEQRKS